jgi:acetyl coenzyme A synthetase (ADP forming)-like protein
MLPAMTTPLFDPSRAPKGLDALFRPRSVAVVGTSARPRTIGREILSNLLEGEFQGVVFPVNPHLQVCQSLRCWPTVDAIPDPVDLVVTCVPAAAVPEVARQCAGKGVGGMVIISAGFREIGPAGRALEDEVMAIARAASIRVIGPNCMGIVYTDPAVRLNASFAAARPIEGNVAFVSQSGALGEAILSEAHDLGLGISYFVSAGNRADVSTNELLEYWEDDPRVGPILLYLESVGEARRFPEIARRLTRKKPVIVVKAGRTLAGARAARSHTGSLAGADVAIDTLLGQVGVLRVNSMEDLFAAASAFASQPLPAGSRVGIVTNSGGPGILATDACGSLELQVPELTEATRAALAPHLPKEASLRNPVDMIASAGPEAFEVATAAVLRDENVDALLVLFITPVYVDSIAVADAIVRACAGSSKPVLTCFMGKEGHAEAVGRLRKAGIPVYQFPESPARALATMVRQRAWLDREPGSVPSLVVDAATARGVVRAARADGRTSLGFEEARRVAEAYGFPFARGVVATSLEEVIDAAEDLGFPLVLKATAPGLSHKSDRGGVAVDLRTVEELAAAWKRMKLAFAGEAGLCYVVQRMARGDREVILGMRKDEDFGPLLMFGLGGIHVEVLKDVSFRVHPITDADARDMIRSLRGYPLLQGVRGKGPVPEDLVIEMLLRLDRLVHDLPEILELDLNPVMLSERRDDCLAVDVRVTVAAT